MPQGCAENGMEGVHVPAAYAPASGAHATVAPVNGTSGSQSFWAVVPAGGAGTRLWPLSRREHPKFLHDLTGSGRTLLQATLDRLAPLAEGRILVVTGVAHRAAVLDQLPGLAAQDVLAEPSPRDSMAAIGWAAALLERRDPEAVMGSFAADHVIADSAAFVACVERAVAAARDGWLVTLGITPTHPATGFGYIEAAGPLPGTLGEEHGVQAVRRFVEKPDAATATRYLADGAHLWNAGMFVVRPTVLLDLLAEHHPDLAAGLRRLAADPSLVDEVWPGLEKIALDHAVAEPAADAGRVAVVPADFDWDDIGDFDSLATLLADAGTATTVLGDTDLVHALDSTGMVVTAGRPVAVIGLEDVVVVDTPDAVLVTTRERAQDVKKIVAALTERGRTDLT